MCILLEHMKAGTLQCAVKAGEEVVVIVPAVSKLVASYVHSFIGTVLLNSLQLLKDTITIVCGDKMDGFRVRRDLMYVE